MRLGCFLFLAASLLAISSVRAEESGNEFQAARLKAAILESQRRLGELEPHQKKIFVEEVVPNAQRFVKNYGATASGLAIDIDLPAIRNYLSFYAPTTLSQADPKILISLGTDSSCKKCTASTAALKRLVTDQFARRGFKAVWLTPEETGEQVTPKGAENRVKSLAKARGIGSYVVLLWRPLATEDIDSAHADEQRFFVNLSLSFPGGIEQTTRLELLENDSFEQGTSKLMTEAFANLGARETAIAGLAPAASGNQELYFELSGFKDFAQYAKLKEDLQAKLTPERLLLEVRKVSKGSATWAVRTDRSADEVRAKLGELNLAPGVTLNLNGGSK